MPEIGPNDDSHVTFSGGQFEEFLDELNLTTNVSSANPPSLSFPNHVNRLISLNRSPCRLELPKSLLGVHSTFDRSMVLFEDIVKVLHRSVSGRRRILPVNVTDHPSAEWTQQQLREALPGDHPFRFLIHDRDSIFSQELDKAMAGMGVCVLRTPPQAPQANSVCERLFGTIRRECLDFLIPLGQRHLKDTLNRWVLHYNHGRVHITLGPGIPAPLHPSPPQSEHRHQLPPGHRLRCKPVLGGLHHEYWLEKVAA